MLQLKSKREKLLIIDISSCTILVAVLTKGCLKVTSFVSIVKAALDASVKVVVVHDPLSCGFPRFEIMIVITEF